MGILPFIQLANIMMVIRNVSQTVEPQVQERNTFQMSFIPTSPQHLHSEGNLSISKLMSQDQPSDSHRGPVYQHQYDQNDRDEVEDLVETNKDIIEKIKRIIVMAKRFGI